MTKVCSRCRTVKPLTEFSPNKRSPLGVNAACRTCVNARWNTRTAVRQRDGVPIYRIKKDERLRRIYGITLGEFEALWEFQRGRCGSCEDELPEWTDVDNRRGVHLDHDHVTGVIRGLLCFDCNTGAARFKESPLRLVSMVAYLDDPPAPHLLGTRRVRRTRTDVGVTR